jgi:hypothetical protein
MNSKYIKTVILTGMVGMVLSLSTAYADNSWSTYHWARTANPMPLRVIDSVTPDWQPELDTALGEWNASTALDMSVASANDSNRTRKQCKMKAGQMRVCNAAYGFNGWLGRATIGLDPSGHIDQGKAQVNDSYSSYWVELNEKLHVMCQEIGHVFGLGHTSEDGSTQGTCMDYSMDASSTMPNAHDFQQLADMYDHLDDYNSYDDDGLDTGGDVCNAPPGKGCNKNNAGVGLGAGGSPPMGVRVYKDEDEEVWVASRRDGGLWIHHVRLVPDAFRIIR